jgi:prepilin-type N-terminal cleavage/methylation domain-containing protein
VTPAPTGILEFYREGLMLMPAPVFFAILFLFAGMIGSFLNVCIWRIPRGQSIVTPRSACPACGHHLNVADLVPVLSWLASGGKCRYCEAPIALRYQTVELINISLWMIAWAVFGRSIPMLGAGAVASTVVGVVGVSWMRRKLAAEAPSDAEGEAESEAEAPPSEGSEVAPGRAGFTFIEIVVSVAILGSIITPFLLAIQGSYRGSGRNRELIQAYNLAREKVEELRAVPVAKLQSDWDVYVAGESSIFANEFFGPYARMKQNPENFYSGFSDVWTEDKKFTESVMALFTERFKEYYGFEYEPYDPGYERFRRYSKVEDLTSPEHPNNVLKKVTVTVLIETKGTKPLTVELVAYMVNR